MASIYQSHKPAAGEGGGLYLKISDGETVKLRIASEPAIFETEGERDDPNNPGEKIITITTRYGWLVWNQETKQAQILQQSATFFKNLAALASDDEWGDPIGYDIKITREGGGFNDTKYFINPSPNREPLSNEAKEALAKIDLLEKLTASPFSQRVMWLADYDKQAAGSEPDYSKDIEKVEAAGKGRAVATADSTKKDTVVTEIDDEPINLDDIPF